MDFGSPGRLSEIGRYYQLLALVRDLKVILVAVRP
jgi:hypothetical protein